MLLTITIVACGNLTSQQAQQPALVVPTQRIVATILPSVTSVPPTRAVTSIPTAPPMTPTPAAPLPTKRIETSTLVLATAITTATLQGGALVDALRQGGYVICFRHTKTLWIQHDTDVTNLQYCQLQRNLSGAGREDAIAIGKAFEALEIPVNAVYASPFCRTMETAQLAFHQATPEQVLVHTPATPTMRDTEEAIAGMRQFLGMVPSQGSNIVVVGHTPNMVATTGIGPVEGGAVIVAPNGKGEWDVVVQVQPEEWSQLAVIFGRSTP